MMRRALTSILAALVIDFALASSGYGAPQLDKEAKLTERSESRLPASHRNRKVEFRSNCVTGES